MREEVLRVAVVKAFANALKRAKDVADKALLSASNEAGVRRAVALLPDGTEVADVTIAVPKREAKVTDAAAFTAWVKAHEPRAIVPEEVVPERVIPASVIPESVDAEYAEQVLAAFVERDGVAFDPETGEEVAGVTFSAKAPYPTVKFRKGGEEATLAAIKTAPELLMLTE